MKRTLLIALATVAAVAGVASAAVLSGGLPTGRGPTEEPTVVAVPEPTTEAPATPTATPTPVATTPPAPVPTTEPPSGETPDDQVAHVQQRLTDLGYYVGAIDGAAGPATASAVQAFQKVQGLVADGVIGPNTVAALESPVIPELRGGPANRIEVDLDDQVLYLVQGGELARILPISSGSGETYSTAGGGSAVSLTPVGSFTVERHIRGVRNAPLGTLYDPMYFHRGWAIHGSNSVPAYPASHGCVRVTRADAQWLFDRVPIGMSVEVYGNTNAFSPALGESAGTATPAGDTADTTPDDGIQTEEPTAPAPSPTAQPTTPAPAPTTPPPPPEPEPTTPAPSTEPTPAPTPTPPPAPAISRPPTVPDSSG
ncbi:L,D-transpeptidase family protein [Euzebya sp.]|uniref:L,D-transpeptidase family protein n=1 Tax=Euzebya sp. TaxID=1971409 RepID=UPI0035195C94